MVSDSDKFQGIYTVYMHTAPNGWVYIGMTGKSLTRRFRSDGSGYKNQPKFYDAIKFYGWNNITHEVIGCFSDKVKAHELERTMILKNKDHCFNVHSTSETYAATWKYEHRKNNSPSDFKMEN